MYMIGVAHNVLYNVKRNIYCPKGIYTGKPIDHT